MVIFFLSYYQKQKHSCTHTVFHLVISSNSPECFILEKGGLNNDS